MAIATVGFGIAREKGTERKQRAEATRNRGSQVREAELRRSGLIRLSTAEMALSHDPGSAGFDFAEICQLFVAETATGGRFGYPRSYS